jgi:hypothetical protein
MRQTPANYSRNFQIMTVKNPYTFRMNIFCLLSAHLWGLVWLGVLFGVSFCLVLIAKLVYLGRVYQKQQSQPPTPTPKTEEKQNSSVPKTEEPVYYIVERKKRVKSSFSEPKQIRFK